MWKIIVWFIKKRTSNYVRAVRSGKDIYIVKVYKSISETEEMQKTIDALKKEGINISAN